MTGPDEALGAALRAFAARARVLVALDFDGVLAPIVAEPSAAAPLPASADALERLLRAPGTAVALVSGRALASLRAAADPPPGGVLVASHGAEVDGAPPALDAAAREALAAAVRDVEEVVASSPGTAVETKPAGVVLHTRGAAPDVAARASAAVLGAAAARPGVHAMEGKSVVELTVVEASKGAAVAVLRAGLGVEAVLYAGDDVTDETVLTTLDPARDVGVKVGEGPTAAPHRVADPEAVARLLTDLVALRAPSPLR